jgi:hypothetical protein
MEIIRAIQQVEPIAVRHGHDVDDFVKLCRLPFPFTAPLRDDDGYYWADFFGSRKRCVPPPRDAGLAKLPTDGVQLFDRARRTLVVDEWGRPAVGPTVAERLEAQREMRAAEMEMAAE